MSNAVATGRLDLTTLEAKSTSSAPPKLAHPVLGTLVLNGVRVSLRSDSVDSIAKTINRFTTQTLITASVAASTLTGASTDAKAKYLILTSPEDMSVDGDSGTLATLGLTSNVTKCSTAVAASPVYVAPVAPATITSTGI
jgi:hypothetical protein